MTDNIINPPDYRNDTVLPLPMEVTANAWAVDAACSGNPGPMEYQAIDLATGAQVFHFGPVHGTNNIGEFLAIVHALALLDRQGVTGRPSIPTRTTPFYGCRSANARPSCCAHRRPNSSIKSLHAPRTGSEHTR